MGLTFNPAVMGTGAKSIDDQHRQLVDIINHLLLSMAGGKAKDEALKGAALAAHVGRRARKGKLVEGMKALRVLAS